MTKRSYKTSPPDVDLIERLQGISEQGLEFVREYTPTGDQGGTGHIYNYRDCTLAINNSQNVCPIEIFGKDTCSCKRTIKDRSRRA